MEIRFFNYNLKRSDTIKLLLRDAITNFSERKSSCARHSYIKELTKRIRNFDETINRSFGNGNGRILILKKKNKKSRPEENKQSNAENERP